MQNNDITTKAFWEEELITYWDDILREDVKTALIDYGSAIDGLFEVSMLISGSLSVQGYIAAVDRRLEQEKNMKEIELPASDKPTEETEPSFVDTVCKQYMIDLQKDTDALHQAELNARMQDDKDREDLKNGNPVIMRGIYPLLTKNEEYVRTKTNRSRGVRQIYRRNKGYGRRANRRLP